MLTLHERISHVSFGSWKEPCRGSGTRDLDSPWRRRVDSAFLYSVVSIHTLYVMMVMADGRTPHLFFALRLSFGVFLTCSRATAGAFTY
jgi:hypothetical protein